MDTTIDEARRCPKCQELGRKTAEGPGASRGSKELTFTCENERCVWFEQTCSVVTIRPDGTIPDPNRHRTKMFHKVPDRSEQVRAMLDAQIAAERSGRNNEIRGR